MLAMSLEAFHTVQVSRDLFSAWRLPSTNVRLRAGVVDICLIPEVNFDVPALMAHARLLLQQKGHIVVRACSHATLKTCSGEFAMASDPST